MNFKTLDELKADFRKIGHAKSMTHFDRMRQALTNAIAQRMHKHIKPHPHAIDEDDVIVEEEGWLTDEELMAAAHIINVHTHYWPQECEIEAAKRNVI